MLFQNMSTKTILKLFKFLEDSLSDQGEYHGSIYSPNWNTK